MRVMTKWDKWNVVLAAVRRPLGNFTAWLWNLLLVYVLYSVCRLTFMWVNWDSYAATMTFGHAMDLLWAGLRFDTSAILYTNALVMLLLMLPLHVKERRGYYRVVRWIFVVVNSLCLYSNLIDCVYFQFTGKRTTISVLREFSHEGAGNMTRIFGEQFLANWYLVLLAAVLTWALWKLFRAPRTPRTSALLPYYVVNVLLIVGMAPLFVFGMRGGATHATRPITISNANQYVDFPAETGIVLNTPFSVIRTFNKRPFVSVQYMGSDEAERLFSPVHRAVPEAPFRNMNVVVFILESFGKQHFGFYNDTLRGGTYEGFTPFLDSLCRNCAYTFEYSYSNGRKSIEGMPSVLSGLPNYVEPLFLTPASLNKMSGLARELGSHKGYTTAFFHGAENGSMGFQAFANATGFQRYYGRTEYNRDPNYRGDDDFDGTWAIWDEEFLQYFCDEMSRMSTPFMTAVFTATSHTPFALPDRYKGKFPEGRHRIQRCVAYSDHAMRQFFRKASRQPWFSNTLFVITADHVSGQVDPVHQTTLGHYSVPIILYAPGHPELHGYDRDRVVEQTDIMPTVLSYLNYDKPYVAFGNDMLTTPPDSTFALHWVPEFDGYEYVEGNYLLQFDGTRTTAVYRYRTDPMLRENLLHVLPADSIALPERRMKAVIQQYMQRMNDDQLTVE